MRTALLRVVIALPALGMLYCGQFWATRAGNGCDEARDDKLAVLGTVLLGAGALALAAAVLKRFAVGGVVTAVGLVVLLVAFGTAISCLQ